ncbi:MAG: homocysteine S-methyltransferase family protein [Pseudomonadales bacterium]|nr:homocysteine S-methyltransferase family protein [Pseudomonadales bacterium]
MSARVAGAGHGLWSAKALVDAPDVVVDIHREYIDAGAAIIGGCCGISLLDIQALSKALANTD